jgi:adenosylhomocysteine nucleosidase
MKIAIICAMEEELNAIKSSLGLNLDTKNFNNQRVYTASYKNHEIYFILCGIGKVNAAIHTQKIISEVKLDYIINVGVAGSLSKDLSFGDVVIATDLVQHDMDVRGFGIKLGQIPRMDVFAFSSDEKLLAIASSIEKQDYKIVSGRIASGDQFIDDARRANFIHDEFNALACEMEGAAIAQTCYLSQVPFIVVRSLSDRAGNEDGTAIHSYDELKDMAASRAAFVVSQLLEKR